MNTFLIKLIRIAHCKRGPDICEKCREMDGERICLLEVFPTGSGMAQRRVTELNRGGKKEWLEFEVVRVFDSRDEAEEYARQNQIKDVEL